MKYDSAYDTVGRSAAISVLVLILKKIISAFFEWLDFVFGYKPFIKIEFAR